jgi:hypothetical protein
MATTCLRIDQEILTKCRNSRPGIVEVYLANFADVTGVTLNAGSTEVTGVSGYTASGETSGMFYTIAQNREAAGLVDEAQINIPNGTAIYKPQLTFKIASMDTVTRTIFKELSQASVIAIFKDLDGIYYLVGRQNGLDMETGTFNSGVASGDFKGLEVMLSGLEPEPIIQLATGVIDTGIIVVSP